MDAAARDLGADRALLLEAVRAAGALALDYFKRGVKSWEKGPDDPVSEADLAVDALLKERLHGARPHYGWLSEESEDDPARLTHARVWIVDPIDGTRAFLRGDPEFSVAVALVENRQPVLGVVFNPAKDELYDAARRGGARLNGRPVHVADRRGITGARLLAGKRPFRDSAWTQAVDGVRFRFVNSMAYRLALVAAGRHDATVTDKPKSDWDLAAAHVLVSEAGGAMTTMSGGRLAYNGPNVQHPSVVAANPVLHRVLLKGLAPAAAGSTS